MLVSLRHPVTERQILAQSLRQIIPQATLSTTAFNLEKCTLAQAHPEWLVRWISRTQPRWHITDHCTFDRPTVLPAVCPLCLSDDLRAGHSQYLRLAWYCSILTICPVHRTPMVTCCSAQVWHHRFGTRAGMPIHRSCCLECRRHLDGPQSWGPHVDQFAISALLFFESLLRNAIAQRREADASAYGFAILIQPIQDLAWALMRPVPGSFLRVLHFMQTHQFRVPPGLNTPIESSNWLASGSIGLRRCLLAVIASLILSPSKSSTLTSEAGKDCRSGRRCGPYTAPRTGANSAGELQHGAGSQPPDWNSTGKGIKPPIEARFLQVKEKRHRSRVPSHCRH
jgi:hypothetical protein